MADVKARIATARTRAVLAVNSELILLYWEIGGEILARQSEKGWGTKVIARLAADLRREFPEMTGLSRSNLHYMRSFAAAWPLTEVATKLSHSLRDNCPGATSAACSTSSRTPLIDVASGTINLADTTSATVSGGESNLASGFAASISGGGGEAFAPLT